MPSKASHPDWTNFEGSHREIGRQLGRYWVKRLKACGETEYGCKFLKKNPYKKKWLKEPEDEWTEGHDAFVETIRHRFPALLEEVHGMAEGVRDAGYRNASFKGVFRVCLGDIEDEGVLGCSTIAYPGRKKALLAHNEEDTARYPLCYAVVKVAGRTGSREFLSISYPFQFFGSAVGANASLAFTGNSIGMSARRTEAVQSSLADRMPKTVFARLMLERRRATDIKRLFTQFHAVLPCHWYVASSGGIVSFQIRPGGSTRESAAKQLVVLPVHETSCHTNHFQTGVTLLGGGVLKRTTTRVKED